MKKTILILLVFAGLFNINGQESAENQNEQTQRLLTPYDAVFNHLNELQPEDYNPSAAARSMYNGFSMETRVNAAIELKQYLDAKGLYVDLDLVPKNPQFKDTLRSGNTFQIFRGIPEIYLVRKDGVWMYSAYTTKIIDELHSQLYPFGSEMLISLLPQSTSVEFLGLLLWQWIGIFVLLGIAVLLYFILKVLIRFTIRGFIRKYLGVSEKTARLILRIEKPGSFLLVVKVLQIASPVLLLPVDASKYLVIILGIFFTVFIIILALRLIDLFIYYFSLVAEKTENTLDDQLIPVLDKLIKSLVIVTGVFYILKLLNVNVTALIAGISISGLALALAAQDTVKNLIGSVMIFFDKPFQIGDWVNFDGKDGVVEEVGMRSTRIRSFENSIIYVPNGKLADAVVNNMGLRKYRRFKTDIGVTYDTPPELIDAFVEGIREIINYHPSTLNETYFVYLNSFGPSSLNILVYTFFNVNDWSGELDGKHEIMQAIIKLAHLLGVRFAFPTQTLHIEEMPGHSSLSPVYKKDPGDIRQKLDGFIAEYKSGLSTANTDQ